MLYTLVRSILPILSNISLSTSYTIHGQINLQNLRNKLCSQPTNTIIYCSYNF